MPEARAAHSNGVEQLVEKLWTPAELADFLGYKLSTVIRMASGDPDRLPPRVRAMNKPRWVPEVCRGWVLAQSRPYERPRMGRPRK
ncbi:hypothetical protein [Roseococcus sp.]|uniref:hypothetical protein n=1 Tax=Roseococcus sp. TaxID=2109646 RepID=UPI003BAC1D1C